MIRPIQRKLSNDEMATIKEYLRSLWRERGVIDVTLTNLAEVDTTTAYGSSMIDNRLYAVDLLMKSDVTLAAVQNTVEELKPNFASDAVTLRGDQGSIRVAFRGVTAEKLRNV